MSQSKRTRDALLNRSVAAMQAGRGASSAVEQSGGVVWISTAEVMPDPDQPRTHFDEGQMRSLVASISALGQIEPILVQALRPDEQREAAGFRFRCLSGHRRLRAHSELGLSEIKAVVIRDALEPAERLAREIATNEVREDHTDYDRARFMGQLFAARLESASTPKVTGKGLDRVKQVVNRAFNELDRSGSFSKESKALVDVLEAELKSIGERRNLRWYHRWGAPVLALEGAALVAALGGLDARRALTISQLSPRGTMLDEERARRESAVEALALTLRGEPLPHRAVALVVKELESRVAASDDPVQLVASVVREFSDNAIPTSEAPAAKTSQAGKKKKVTVPAVAAGRWGIRIADGDRFTDLASLVSKMDARQAVRVAALVEKLERELAVLAPKKKSRR